MVSLAHASALSDLRVGDISLDSVWTAFPIALAGILVWALWLYRVILSRRPPRRQRLPHHDVGRGAVLPRGPRHPAALPGTWLRQDPTEVIIVLDVEDAERGASSSSATAGCVPSSSSTPASDRPWASGIRAARRRRRAVDSDTSWSPGCSPCRCRSSTRRSAGWARSRTCYDRRTSVWRRVADWLVNLRYYDYVPAMGRGRRGACLSGRTAAYRRRRWCPVLEHLENEFFLGRRCIAGDDGRLTWLVLASGYKTVHQSSARALSMFPATFRAFVKQRVRWSRNSYRCYLTAIGKGWLWHVPFVTKVTVLQILLTPVTMGMTLGYLVFAPGRTTPGAASGSAVAAPRPWRPRLVPPASPPARHLAAAAVHPGGDLRRPADQALRLRHDEQAGLADPHADQIGGEGQTAASLESGAQRPPLVVPAQPAPVAQSVAAVQPVAAEQPVAPARPGGWPSQYRPTHRAFRRSRPPGSLRSTAACPRRRVRRAGRPSCPASWSRFCSSRASASRHRRRPLRHRSHRPPQRATARTPTTPTRPCRPGRHPSTTRATRPARRRSSPTRRTVSRRSAPWPA